MPVPAPVSSAPVDQAATTAAINLAGTEAAPPADAEGDIFMKATMALDADKIAEKAAEIAPDESSAPRPKTIMIKRPAGTTSATAKTVKTLRPPAPADAAPTAGGVKTIKLSRPGAAPEGIPAEKKTSTSKVELPEELMAPEESGSRKRTVKIKRPGGVTIAPSVTTDAAAMSDGKLHAAGRTFEFQPTGTDGNIHVTWTVLSVLSFMVSAAALYIILATMIPTLTVPGLERLVNW